jgi:hypothetical protein
MLITKISLDGREKVLNNMITALPARPIAAMERSK